MEGIEWEVLGWGGGNWGQVRGWLGKQRKHTKEQKKEEKSALLAKKIPQLDFHRLEKKRLRAPKNGCRGRTSVSVRIGGRE